MKRRYFVTILISSTTVIIFYSSLNIFIGLLAFIVITSMGILTYLIFWISPSFTAPYSDKQLNIPNFHLLFYDQLT